MKMPSFQLAETWTSFSSSLCKFQSAKTLNPFNNGSFGIRKRMGVITSARDMGKTGKCLQRGSDLSLEAIQTVQSLKQAANQPPLLALMKNPLHSQPPGTHYMRLAYSSYGTAVYKPVLQASSPTYQQCSESGVEDNSVGTVVPHGFSFNMGEPMKRKRGRPRKYALDGAMVLASTPATPQSIQHASVGGRGFSPSGGLESPPSSLKKSRGRPHGSGKKQQMVALDNSVGTVVPHGLSFDMGEPMKRKRGRPRKYSPDGAMALALTPATPQSIQPGGVGGGGGFSTSSGGPISLLSSLKKSRGRPRGSGKKQQIAALGSTGIGFTPHVLTFETGEDVLSKIVSFSQHGSRDVCILSANGAISNVTLRQAAISGGNVTYEGRFEILSLSGSYLLAESSGQRIRTGGLSVSLAGPDGCVLGGGVAGLLTAAGPVQVVVGSFIADGHKESKPNHSEPSSAAQKLPQGGVACLHNSQGTMSKSSGGPGSPLNQSTEACNGSNSPGKDNILWK